MMSTICCHDPAWYWVRAAFNTDTHGVRLDGVPLLLQDCTLHRMDISENQKEDLLLPAEFRG